MEPVDGEDEERADGDVDGIVRADEENTECDGEGGDGGVWKQGFEEAPEYVRSNSRVRREMHPQPEWEYMLWDASRIECTCRTFPRTVSCAR